METVYYGTDDGQLTEAARVIQRGGLVAFPTETVYGLGGNAFSAAGAKAIYAAKGRPSDNPLIVHIADTADLGRLAAEIPPAAHKLAEAFWPGPLTMVFRKKPEVPDETTGGLPTVAVRMPDSEPTLKLIRLAGLPLAGPSANLSGRPSPTAWQHVRDDLDGRIDGIIKGEPCRGGIESTVLDVTGEGELVILRPGLITPEMISMASGLPVSYDPAVIGRPEEGLVPRAPGMKYKHYAPKCPMILYSGSPENVLAAIKKKQLHELAKGQLVMVLAYGPEKKAIAPPEVMAREFFANLRELDDAGADLILAAALPEGDSLSFSLMNRMLRSAAFHVEVV